MCVSRFIALTSMATLTAAAAGQVIPIVDFDGDFFANPGATVFGSFETDVVQTQTSILIDTPEFGGLGVGVAADAFDSDEVQLRVRARLLPGNEADSFAIGIIDDDGDDSAPGLGSEVWEWRIPTAALNENDFVDLVYSLGSTPLQRRQADDTVNDGDESPNFGAEYFFLQSEFSIRSRLAIEIEEIAIEPVCITADYVIADYGGGFAGGGFGAFADPGVLTETDDSLQIASNDFGGGGRQLADQTDIDAARYQLRVNARLLPGNGAAQFRVVIGDSDGDDTAPGTGTENWEYVIPTAELQEGVYTDVIVPLTSTSGRNQNFNSTNDGDEEVNFGATEWFIQSNFGSTDALRVEIRDVVIEPVTSTPGIALGDFDGDILNFGIFTFESFSGSGAVTDGSDDSIIIDVSGFGGLGRDDGTIRNFESTAAIEIVARMLPGNTASGFNLVLVDTDGDDTGPGTGVEEYQFAFGAQDFGAAADNTVPALGEFITFTQQLLDPGPVFRQQGFNSLFDGDEVQNYGLTQWQIQSQFDSTDRLHIEIDSVRIVSPFPSYDTDPDYNQDGQRDFFDVLEFLENPADLTNDGTVDDADTLFYLKLFDCACPA
jgi:hypothetical protein